MSNVIIIGGGASGMMAAYSFAKNNNSVTLIEQNNKLGKKIYITGKGRCNVTNNSDNEKVIENTRTNPYFLYSSLYTFDTQMCMEYFEKMGVPLKTERGNRVFPVSDKASDIIKAMTKSLNDNNVKVMLNKKVENIIVEDGQARGVIVDGKEMRADKVVVATGGLSYSMCGSTGDGYKFAEELGHKIKPTYPSLVPLTTNETDIKDLMGLSLKNIGLSVYLEEKGKKKKLYEEEGEMLFAHYGITGPLVLKASTYLCGHYGKKITAYIDFKPALDADTLDKRILRDFEKNINKSFKNSLNELLPQKMIPVIIERSKIHENKRVNEITKEERKVLVDLIKGFSINITGNTGYNDAVITKGGVDVKEVDPSTMMSKLVDNLYFVGEVLDIDCFTGGFNLQVAFSTGYLAGEN